MLLDAAPTEELAFPDSWQIALRQRLLTPTRRAKAMAPPRVSR